MKNNKRETLLAALLVHPTVREAAQAASIPETTAYNWLRKPDFAEEYKQRKRQTVAEASDYLQSRINSAVQVINGLMTDRKVSARVRLDAARSIIELGYKIVEQAEIIARIEALEAANMGDTGQ